MIYKHLLSGEYIKDTPIKIKITTPNTILYYGCFCMSLRKISDFILLNLYQDTNILTFDTDSLKEINVKVFTETFNEYSDYFIVTQLSYTMNYSENHYGFKTIQKTKKEKRINKLSDT